MSAVARLKDRRFYSAAELAAMKLPGLPATKREINAVATSSGWREPAMQELRWRRREGLGGGFEYAIHCLPIEAQVGLIQREMHADAPVEAAKPKRPPGTEHLSARQLRAALDKIEAIDAVARLCATGMRKTRAVEQAAEHIGFCRSSFFAWEAATLGEDRQDWAALLAPGQGGAPPTADVDPDAWDMLASLYLSPSKPTFEWCFRELTRAAREKGWAVPSGRTLKRRLQLIPVPVRTLAREGEQALKRVLPPQVRDRSGFHALEAVNADGHRFDVFVRWPDGTVGRPVMVAFQDLHSGMILSWRLDRTENKEAVRLAFGDVVETHGIPDHCWLDNGRNFASKWLTGGTPNRYRFKVREEDPQGILTLLGVQIHWTTPYHGQAKPIERAFRDMAHDVARNPLFEGAYTGNSPMAKPENYGTRAVPVADFQRVLDVAIEEHNTRANRLSRVCAGRLSFAQAFATSAATAPIRRLSANQRRIWLLAAEAIGTHPESGQITLLGNRYWHEGLVAWRGKRVVVRFDPQNLHADIDVERLTGQLICRAELQHAVGFADTDAARLHARRMADFKRHTKAALEAERKLTPEQALATIETPATADRGATKQRGAVPADEKIVRPIFRARPAEVSESAEQAERRVLDALGAHYRGVAPPIPGGPREKVG